MYMYMYMYTCTCTCNYRDDAVSFRVRVLGLDNLRGSLSEFDVVYIDLGVFHGGEELCRTQCTTEVPIGKYPRWNQWIVFDISLRNLPKVSQCRL